MKKNKKHDAKLNQNVIGKDISLFNYIGSIPNILLFEIFSKGLLYEAFNLVNFLIKELLKGAGVGTVTNTYIPYLLLSWQGILVLIVGFILLYFYIIIDINCVILISRNILHNQHFKFREIVKEGLQSSKYMLHWQGIFIFIYIVLLAPLVGSIYNISLTSSFYIPDFIMSVIQNNTAYYMLYNGIIVLLFILAFIHLFVFQFMIFRKENISLALKDARVAMKRNWKNFLKRYLIFLFKYLLVLIGIVTLTVAVPYLIIQMTTQNGNYDRFWISLFAFNTWFIGVLFNLLFPPFQIMELTRIYESYTEEEEGELIPPSHSLHVRFWLLMALAYGCMAFLAFMCTDDTIFDTIFPLKEASNVVAHRAGGSLGPENSIIGLNKAIEKKVYGAETDIQRTKDGYYIINHDDTFERLSGVDKTPSELTLEEIKKLKLNDYYTNGPSTEYATLDEFLDAGKDKIHLFIELKGKTADSQMVEDLHQKIVEKDMVDDVTVISLKYDLLAQMESEHPEIDTGYLCYLSLGDIKTLECDKLLLEDELATDDVIEEAHEVNKEVYIWTVDSDSTIKKRLLDSSDGIITDEVTLADSISDQLEKRDDFSRVLDMLMIYIDI